MPLWMIIDAIRRVAARSDIREFYVGRTSDLQATMYRHGADSIFRLAYFNSADRAKRAERAAIAATIHLSKSSNRQA